MVRDLLDYTQAHLGSGIPIERRPANVYAIVRQVVEEVQAAHPDRIIEVRERGSGLGHYDTDRLAQVVSNLLSNALAYSPPDTAIVIDGRDDGGRVSVSVNNRGEPIPPERLARIFEPMQRAVTAPTAASRSWSGR